METLKSLHNNSVTATNKKPYQGSGGPETPVLPMNSMEDQTLQSYVGQNRLFQVEGTYNDHLTHIKEERILLFGETSLLLKGLFS